LVVSFCPTCWATTPSPPLPDSLGGLLPPHQPTPGTLTFRWTSGPIFRVCPLLLGPPNHDDFLVVRGPSLCFGAWWFCCTSSLFLGWPTPLPLPLAFSFFWCTKALFCTLLSAKGMGMDAFSWHPFPVWVPEGSLWAPYAWCHHVFRAPLTPYFAFAFRIFPLSLLLVFRLFWFFYSWLHSAPSQNIYCGYAFTCKLGSIAQTVKVRGRVKPFFFFGRNPSQSPSFLPRRCLV